MDADGGNQAVLISSSEWKSEEQEVEERIPQEEEEEGFCLETILLSFLFVIISSMNVWSKIERKVEK